MSNAKKLYKLKKILSKSFSGVINSFYLEKIGKP